MYQSYVTCLQSNESQTLSHIFITMSYILVKVFSQPRSILTDDHQCNTVWSHVSVYRAVEAAPATFLYVFGSTRSHCRVYLKIFFAFEAMFASREVRISLAPASMAFLSHSGMPFLLTPCTPSLIRVNDSVLDPREEDLPHQSICN